MYHVLQCTFISKPPCCHAFVGTIGGEQTMTEAEERVLMQLLSNERKSEKASSQRSAFSKEELPADFDNWVGGLDAPHIQKRLGSEYYDDYAANDEREQGTFSNSDENLSRNRQKAFDAMNQQLKGFQHARPRPPQPEEGGGGGGYPEAGGWPQQYPQTQSRKKIGPGSRPQQRPQQRPPPPPVQCESW